MYAMRKHDVKILAIFVFLAAGNICAQDDAKTYTTLNEETAGMIAEGKVTVALLDFEGRGINAMEAATLTDRLMSELANEPAASGVYFSVLTNGEAVDVKKLILMK